MLGLPSAEIMAGYESRAQAPKAPASQPANVRLRTDAPAMSKLPWPSIVGAIAAVLLVVGVLWWKPWHQRGAGRVASETLAANPSAASADAATDSAAAAGTSGLLAQYVLSIDVVDTVPMVRYFMVGELTDKHKAEFQKFIDFSTAAGTLPQKVDITKYLQAY